MPQLSNFECLVFIILYVYCADLVIWISNFNYGPAGEALGLDLLSNPDLVATDADVSLGAAIWFWMTPRDDKPSCHDVIVGAWTPNEADLAANRLPGYGLITNIINQGECGHGADKRVANRIGFFERYCSMLGVEAGDNLDCYHQCSFSKLSDECKYRESKY